VTKGGSAYSTHFMKRMAKNNFIKLLLAGVFAVGFNSSTALAAPVSIWTVTEIIYNSDDDFWTKVHDAVTKEDKDNVSEPPRTVERDREESEQQHSA